MDRIKKLDQNEINSIAGGFNINKLYSNESYICPEYSFPGNKLDLPNL